MPVTATSLAAATTMLAAVVAIFVTFVLCFYLFLCAKRYRGAAPTLTGARGRARFVFSGEDSAPWCRGRGLDEATIAALPRKEVRKDEAVDCAVCITELAAGEAARFLPRCGHGFHVDCIDMWLPSHSTCPLCRCPVVDAPPQVAAPATVPPEADQESPNFPTNVLYFGSQDAVSTGGSAPPPQAPTPMPPPLPPPAPVAAVAAIVEAARVHALRRLLGCGGATPMPQPQAEGDIETGLAGGESSVSRPAKPQAG